MAYKKCPPESGLIAFPADIFYLVLKVILFLKVELARR